METILRGNEGKREGWGSVIRSSDKEIGFFCFLFYLGRPKKVRGNFLIAIDRGILLIFPGHGLAFPLLTFKFRSQFASLDSFQVLL